MARICHLTVLNPARHSRIFFKEALSQVEAGHEVVVIGQGKEGEDRVEKGIRVLSTGTFHRLSRRRWTARQWMLDLAAPLQADIYWIHAPELLPVGQDLKAQRPGTRIVYDVHEDYPANIRAHYPRPLAGRLAGLVERSHRSFGRWGDAVVYAEDCYDGMIPFPLTHTRILRNKFRPSAPENGGGANLPRPYLLYTGTLAREWGVLRALEFWQQLRTVVELDLVMAGHTHDEAVLEEMANYVEGAGLQSHYHLEGGLEYVPHERIVQLIRGCVAGTAFYAPLPHLLPKVPTKWYEYMACHAKLFYSRTEQLDRLNQRIGFGQPVDFPLSWEDRAAWESYLSTTPPEFPREEWSWETEARQMNALIKQLLPTSI